MTPKLPLPLWPLFILLSFISTTLGQDTFTNPIIDGNSADPFVGKVGEHYYMTLSTSGERELTIYKSSELTNFRNVESKVIFRAPEGYHNVWASEMFEMPDGNLYIYFAMGRIGEFNRNWVIKADNPMDPMGNWSTEAIRLLPHLEWPGVDGTILKHGGKVYYVWSGRNGESIPHDSILITEMIDPVTTTERTTIIRQPRLPWERNVNEGPYFIYNRNVSYLLFAASFTFSEYYCLGLMSIEEHLDPMNASNWWYGPEDGPVFYKNDEERVFGSGHASFTVSPDGSETWMVYHASEDRERIEHYRIARAEKVEWDEVTGRPVFPRPHGYYSPIPLPSGQRSVISKPTFTNPILSGDSPDPKVLLVNGTYYLPIAHHSGNSILIHSSKHLTNFRNALGLQLSFGQGDCISEIWAPELKVLEGSLYLYLSAKNCSEQFHTVYVSKAVDPTNPLGSWSDLVPLLPQVRAITADGSVMERNGELYLVFESREDPYGLWIAEMTDPQTVRQDSRQLLKRPTESWEAGVVNGPAFVRRGNKTWMTYSAGNPNGPDYSTGLMGIEDGRDPFVAANWEMKLSGPVFAKDEAERVFGPGHVGFTTSPDGTETWITYHAAEYSNRIFGNRVSRTEKLEWDENEEPVFPKPHGYFSPQPLPSGQQL